MRHFNNEEWSSYIKDELLEPEREELEDHLFSCDQCLDHYMKMIDTLSDQLPKKEDSRFTEALMKKLLQKKKRRKTFYQHPLFHYGVAAVITFTLMTTGIFQSITGIVATVEASPILNPEQTVSNSLMEKAFSLFQPIEEIQKEVR
ncbi:zf-HC2 domain-containing protein [Bacillus sp. DJP31]|uniref:zf-HC2 domain-containing protein n=1 Tax=Bacillus sp. DJP31 TaxID=3409789 RepID=UPI003BB69BC0